MNNFNQPAYPTTPEHHGYPSGMEDVHMYSGSGLSKLQRVASEQLAALIIASQSEDGCPPLEDRDMKQDDAGYWQKHQGGYWSKATSTTLPKDRYTIATSLKARLARHAVEYAKALLEMTE